MAKKATKKRAPLRDEFADNASSVVPFPAKRTRARKHVTGQESVDERLPTSAPLVCKNKAQENYKQKIESSTITFGIGPAGTGKSYVALKIAAQMLEDNQIERIVVTRPAIGVEEDLGALPGTIEEKSHPWFQPMLEILEEHFGRRHVEGKIHAKRIQFVPMSHLRGRTFNNSFILLDEAQNTTPRQMKALLTRIGRFSTLVVDGDIDQVDIKGRSGLRDAMNRLQNIKGISVAMFEIKDIVRHELIKDILQAYANYGTEE